MVQKTLQISTIRYFGSGLNVNKFWAQKLNLSGKALSYHKIMKNRCLNMASFKHNKRPNNAFVQLINRSYVQLICFIADLFTQKEYTIVKKIFTVNSFNNNCCSVLQKVLEVNDESVVY